MAVTVTADLILQEGTEKTESTACFQFLSLKGTAMHALFASANDKTHDVIGSAIEVHKDKGLGLLESIYEWCLTMELESRGHFVQNQDNVIVRYKQFEREYPLRFDLLVDKCLIV